MASGKQPRQPDLDKWREFANQYIIDFNATEAYCRCTWTRTTNRKSAQAAASRLITDDNVISLVNEALESRKKRLELDQDVVVKEQLRIALADIRNYMKWDKDGLETMPSDELTEDAAHAIETVEYWENETENGTSRKMKFKLHSKASALESLAKHLGMYTEKREYHHTFGSVEVPAMADPDEWQKVIEKNIGDDDGGSDSPTP